MLCCRLARFAPCQPPSSSSSFWPLFLLLSLLFSLSFFFLMTLPPAVNNIQPFGYFGINTGQLFSLQQQPKPKAPTYYLPGRSAQHVPHDRWGGKKEKKENSSALKSSPFFVISPASNYCVALTSVGNRSGRHCATISQSEVIRPARTEDG